jgi:hypothetical protein
MNIATAKNLHETSMRVSDFLRNLFRLLEGSGVRYCVLHTWELLPERLVSDLDLAIHPEDEAKLLSFEGLRDRGYKPFQRLNYAKHGSSFVFFWFSGTTLNTVAVDIVSEHRRGGQILATGEEMVNGRQRHGVFWIPSPRIQFGYLLAKKICNGKASSAQSLRLKQLVENIGAPAWRRRKRVPMEMECELAVEACVSGSIEKDLPSEAKLGEPAGHVILETRSVSSRRVSPLRPQMVEPELLLQYWVPMAREEQVIGSSRNRSQP